MKTYIVGHVFCFDFLDGKQIQKHKKNERDTGTYKTNVEKKGEDQTNKHNRITKKDIRNNHNNTTQERQQETKQDNGTKKEKNKNIENK